MVVLYVIAHTILNYRVERELVVSVSERLCFALKYAAKRTMANSLQLVIKIECLPSP